MVNWNWKWLVHESNQCIILFLWFKKKWKFGIAFSFVFVNVTQIIYTNISLHSVPKVCFFHFFWLVILIIIYTFVSEVYRLKWKKKCLFLKRVPTASSFNKQIKFKTFKWILHFKNPEISRMIKLKNCARYFEWLLHRKWCKYLPLMIYARNLFLLLFLSTICILSMKISWVFPFIYLNCTSYTLYMRFY